MNGMNFVAKQTAARAMTVARPGTVPRRGLQSEFAVYVIRFDDDGVARFEDANDDRRRARRPARCAKVVGQRPIDCLPPEIGECLETKLAEMLRERRAAALRAVGRGPERPDGLQDQPDAGHRTGSARSSMSSASPATSRRKQTWSRTRSRTPRLLQRLGIALPSAIYLLNIRDNAIRFIGGDPDPQRAANGGRRRKPPAAKRSSCSCTPRTTKRSRRIGGAWPRCATARSRRSSSAS